MNRIIFDTVEKWLEFKKNRLGANDITAIMGLNPFRSALAVFNDKVNNAPPVEVNDAMIAGQYAEDAIANYYNDRSGNRVIKCSKDLEVFLHPDNEMLIGSTDRRILTPEGERGILECKNTSRIYEEDIASIPAAWICQVNWYIGLTGASFGFIQWLELGRKFKGVGVEFNPELFELMTRHGQIFLSENINKGIAPEPGMYDDASEYYKSVKAGSAIEATSDILEEIEILEAISASSKALDEEISQRKNRIQLFIGDNEILTSNGQPVATWKKAKASKIFDKDAFVKDNPEAYSKYLTERDGSRRFLLK